MMPWQPWPKMHVQRDSSQVRSARIRCSASAGSANSIHSRGKSSGDLAAARVVGVVDQSIVQPSAERSSRRSGTAAVIARADAGECRTDDAACAPRLVGMRLGVLDVGSNTVHLLVVDAHRGAHPWPAHSEKTVLRLAEQIGPDGALARDGADALVEAVAAARQGGRGHEADDLLAFATSAVRDATNSTEVLARVRDETGVDLQVLSGEDEARLTFLAVRRWFGWSAGRLLVLDIGGGSLEIAAGIDEEPEVALSLPLGAGRLTRERLARRPADRAGRGRRRCASTSRRSSTGGATARGGWDRAGRHLEDVPHAGPAGRRGALRRRASGRRAR